MEFIEKFENRVEFLKEWVKELKEFIAEAGDSWTWEEQDKVYQLETEIAAKEQYIKTWKEQEAEKKEQNEKLDKFLSQGMGKVIKELRALTIENRFEGKLKDGILKRFKENRYGSVNEKKGDFDSATELIRKHTEKKE